MPKLIKEDSSTIIKYKQAMHDCIKMYLPNIHDSDIENALNYSINKRYKNTNAKIVNNYTNKTAQSSLLDISDYILDRKPIVTAFGTMFMNHGTVPNPLAVVIQKFLDLRNEHKKTMFKFPRGSEDFERYNLLQQLDKIDANGIYGVLGMYTSLIYNINIATSITSQGRALVSSMTLFFEAFLADNVNFGSLNEAMEFINSVRKERITRKFSDREIIDRNITIDECFAKVVLECGYRWIPTNSELNIIYNTISNLDTETRNRVYYKNNLYEFCSNTRVINLIELILKKLNSPMLNSLEVPENVSNEIQLFSDIIFEYVYYKNMYIDRIDRCNNMIKKIVMVSDTDSTIISLDAWYRFIVEKMSGKKFKIANSCINPLVFREYNDKNLCINMEPKVLDYDFRTDEIVERNHTNKPFIFTSNDNMRYSIMNILAIVLDRCVNEYMMEFCTNTNSYDRNKDRPCKILAKNEYTFSRLMMTMVKKSYANIMSVQEGNLVPEDEQLDIKGIECLTKSSKSKTTRDELKNILLEDILKTPAIDQLKFIKDIAILEKKIIDSLRNGEREYYKPVTIKSASSYSDPMRIQGIKASIVWNCVRSEDLPAINLEERNAIDIAKVRINKNTIEEIKDEYPEIYSNMKDMLENNEIFNKASVVEAIAIPLDIPVPKWLNNFIDYTTIVNDNIGGFPYESINIQRMNNKNVNYTNIVKL